MKSLPFTAFFSFSRIAVFNSIFPDCGKGENTLYIDLTSKIQSGIMAKRPSNTSYLQHKYILLYIYNIIIYLFL